MRDKNLKSLEVEALENRVAPILVVVPSLPEPEPGPGGAGPTNDPIGSIPENPYPKHRNPGWLRKTQQLGGPLLRG